VKITDLRDEASRDRGWDGKLGIGYEILTRRRANDLPSRRRSTMFMTAPNVQLP
jgi:hypothetical protein